MKSKFFILLAFTLTASTIYGQEEINLFGNLKLGSYDVGTKQITLIDTLRQEPKEILIRLWYPAKENREKVRFSDYLDATNKLSKPELLKDISVGIGGKENLFSLDSLELLLNAKMKATKEVAPKNGKFPMLVWSIRYGTVGYQSIISEYMASHGFVVAFAEDIPNSAYPWEFQSIQDKEKALMQQVRDINTTIEYIKNLHHVDNTKIGLLSWSYAGESAILAQINNPEIEAVVGLSSVGFSYGVYLGKELTNKIDIEKINVPYLMLSEQVGTNGKTRNPPDLLNSMNPNSRFISFAELSHGNFNAIEGMIPGVLQTDKVHSWSKGGVVAQVGYEVICQMVLSFLNTVFYEPTFDSFDEDISRLINDLPLGTVLISSPKKK